MHLQTVKFDFIWNRPVKLSRIPARVFTQFDGRNFTTHHNCLIGQAVKHIVQLIADRIWKLHSVYCRISAIRHFVYLHKALRSRLPEIVG